MTTFTGYAPAIHCDGCANSIKRSLGKLSGIQDVQVDITHKTIRVAYDPAQITEDAVRARLDAAGFPAEPSGVS